jgi:Xaa-Pro aminopeptidase
MTPSLTTPAAAPHLPVTPKGELAARAARFANRLRADGLDGAFLLHPSSYFWLTGTLGDGWPFVDADGRAFLPLRTSPGRAGHESPLPQAVVRRLSDVPGALAELGAPVRGAVGIETDVVPAGVLERIRAAFPDVEFRDVSRAIREVRAVKSPYEIDWIEKAGRIVCGAMDEALAPEIRAGVKEIDLMAFLEGELRRRRHQGTIRLRRWNLEMHYGMVSFGASACYPCYFDGPDGLEGLYPAVQQGGGEREITPGPTLMVDFVGGAGGYLADRTRIFCLGEPSAEAREAHAFCRELLAGIVEQLRPGAIPSEIFTRTMEKAKASPWADRFMGWGENRVGFVGHGIGLDLDEFPVLAPRFDAPLEAGHVLAVEPKIFLGEAGGVGVENTYVIAEGGCRNVTPGPEEIRILPPTG